MLKRQYVIYFVDILILTASFFLIALYKPVPVNYLTPEYISGFIFLLIVWTAASFYFKKYTVRKTNGLRKLLRSIFLSNFISLGVILLFIVLLWITDFSRLMLFGTIGVATMIELLTGNIYYSLISTRTLNGNGKINPPARPSEIKNARIARDFRQFTLNSDVIKHAVYQECGKGIYSFMCKFLDDACKKTLLVSTSSRFNIELQPDKFYKAVVNMKRVNDIRYINKFFESVNRKLPEGGTFIGCAETKDLRKMRILRKFPPVLNWIYYSMDYMLKRVFPKFILTQRIYYFLTRGNNRVISRAELLGRLYSCGFTLDGDDYVDGLYCFSARKITDPVYDFDPTYGMFIKLRRVGKDGRIIRVYKFRTMHPYAEYLQNYLFENNNLDTGGKYKNDFRVTTLGKMLRALWIDELPMLFNLLKGEIKLVGVRPLSLSYFDLYDKKLQEKRIKYKPGLIPPFYADMPKTLSEIQDSEIRYLDAYSQNPLLTDLRYFRMALVNILLKKARSK
ncbi:MAG: sugar transferase [Bacteroidales bacterium]